MTVVRRTILGLGLFVSAGCPAVKPEFPSGADTSGGDDVASTAVASGDASGPDTRADATGDGETTTHGTPDDSGTAAAMLVVDVSILDFGNVDVGNEKAMELTVTNVGDDPIEGIMAGPPLDPFAFAGEPKYPGEGGDCDDDLAGGESCRIVLALTPSRLGLHNGSIQIESQLGPLTVPLLGRGVGSTENLLVNGGGELPGSPPQGWTESGGSWQGGVSPIVPPYSGLGMLAATEAFDGAWTTLRQVVSIAEYAELVDTGEMRVRFDTQLRTSSNTHDLAWVRLELAAGPAMVDEWESAPQSPLMWTPLNSDLSIAPGTLQVAAELYCGPSGAGEDCNAYFDDVSLVLVYAPASP